MKTGKSSHLASGTGTVSVTLEAGAARDLLQALTLALGAGGGKGKSAAAVAGRSKTGGGKGYGGGQPKR